MKMLREVSMFATTTLAAMFAMAVATGRADANDGDWGWCHELGGAYVNEASGLCTDTNGHTYDPFKKAWLDASGNAWDPETGEWFSPSGQRYDGASGLWESSDGVYYDNSGNRYDSKLGWVDPSGTLRWDAEKSWTPIQTESPGRTVGGGPNFGDPNGDFSQQALLAYMFESGRARGVSDETILYFYNVVVPQESSYRPSVTAQATHGIAYGLFQLPQPADWRTQVDMAFNHYNALRSLKTAYGYCGFEYWEAAKARWYIGC